MAIKKGQKGSISIPLVSSKKIRSLSTLSSSFPLEGRMLRFFMHLLYIHPARGTIVTSNPKTVSLFSTGPGPLENWQVPLELWNRLNRPNTLGMLQGCRTSILFPRVNLRFGEFKNRSYITMRDIKIMTRVSFKFHYQIW